MIAFNENLSPRVLQTLRHFGLSPQCPFTGPFLAQSGVNASSFVPALAPGKILLITGPSGAGKSTLLRQLDSRCLYPSVNLAAIKLPRCACVDCFPNLSLEAALEHLARFGLGEVWAYLRSPMQLSEGERFRLRLAIAFDAAARLAAGSHAHGAAIVADEFASCLDRITARIIARNLRRTLTPQSPLCLLLATAHDDLQDALRPDHVIHCDYGRWNHERTSREPVALTA